MVLFTGSGTTGAINKLVQVLELDSPIVFVGPHEHHSNLLPWREVLGAKVVNIKENDVGQTDMEQLEQELQNHAKSGITSKGFLDHDDLVLYKVSCGGMVIPNVNVMKMKYCQALSISQSFNLSLSLRDRDRADTIITFHPPPQTF